MEKEEIYDVFKRVGQRMSLKDLPNNYDNWLIDRNLHLDNNLYTSKFTTNLFVQYKKYLGIFRYKVLLVGKILVLARQVKKLLEINDFGDLKPMIFIYKFLRKIK